MAILAGAIAPALIKYIDKSRKSNDVSSAKTIKTAVETALGTESVYELLVNTSGSNIIIAQSQPTSKALSSYESISAALKVSILGTKPETAASEGQALTLIGTNIGEKTPKIKYKKTASSMTAAPQCFYASINNKGTVSVGVTSIAFTDGAPSAFTDANHIELAPTLDEDYQ
jgi:type IV pilus assembly protein PilA